MRQAVLLMKQGEACLAPTAALLRANGVAVDIEGDSFAADLSGETLRRTSLGEIKPGAAADLKNSAVR